jgi:hypothetical protein
LSFRPSRTARSLICFTRLSGKSSVVFMYPFCWFPSSLSSDAIGAAVEAHEPPLRDRSVRSGFRRHKFFAPWPVACHTAGEYTLKCTVCTQLQKELPHVHHPRSRRHSQGSIHSHVR